MFWYYIAILAAMLLLGAGLSAGLIRGSVINRRRFDQSLLRYEPRHAVTQPRSSDPDPWATLLLPSGKVTYRQLTDTGAQRRLEADTTAWIAEHCPGDDERYATLQYENNAAADIRET
jgi:hypothetical protein